MSHGIEAFGYEYLTDGQSSPELTINKNLLANYVLHKGIADRDLTAPPGSPADGAAYIPAATATGAWAGHEDDIAYWFDETGVWKFLVPEVGISVYVDDEAVAIRYYGGSAGWDVIAGTGTVTSVDTAGTVAGLTLTGGPITGSGTVTLGGTLSVDLTSMVTGVLPVANGGTGSSSGNLSSCTADGTNAVGFRHIPQNSQSAAYTTVLSDAGKHILHPAADTTARTITIDSNANVAYPLGTAITFVNENAAGVMTIAITSDTLVLAGAGTTGSRTLAANGVATAIKITSTSWIISGTGLT